MARFAGDRKEGEWITARWERALVAWGVPLLPRWIHTWQLTLLTLLWSLLALLCFHLARGSLSWLWAVSALVALQYLTDLFDGALGRHRGTGLVKWGFHMDHLLDYLFQGCLVIGYWMIAPEGLDLWFLGILLLTGGFMVNSFLWFAATNRFEISWMGIGPTETRALVIGMNASIAFLGTSWWPATVPAVLACLLLALACLAYRTQARLWAMDMEAVRRERERAGPGEGGL